MPSADVRWSGVTIDCHDPALLARFWATLMPREISVPLPGWLRLGSLGDSLPVVNFQPVPEAKAGKARLHLDLRVDDIEAAAAAVVRAGGRLLGPRQDYDEGVVVVMADPEGNEFCLVQYFGVPLS